MTDIEIFLVKIGIILTQLETFREEIDRQSPVPIFLNRQLDQLEKEVKKFENAYLLTMQKEGPHAS